MKDHLDKHLKWAHPLVREWFLSRFGSATEPQIEGWPHILDKRATLISAPTGSGKTLAAFLVCIDQLVRKAIAGKLEDKTEVVYISPLKALSNDVQKNLDAPLREIVELAASRGMAMKEIRTAVRTGDTLANERQSMLRKPPHILVTTPESLYILLTAEKSRQILRNVRTVIVDEIHAIADDKRGSHLTLSLERLEALAIRAPVRIGLSATQKPIEQVGHFLVGSRRNLPVIVNVGHKRKLDTAVVSLGQPLGAVFSNEMWEETYEKIVEWTKTHRSILVFVNTRKFAERMAFRLAARLGEDAVAAHHGSLSRKIRLSAEHRLKNGQLKVLVATASLELGIDIGDVDLVCLIMSPRSIAAALQRIGRAGHWRGAVPKGRIFATTRDELIECAALLKAIKDSELDRLIIPEQPLDILAQQIVAMCGAEEWQEDELFALCKQAYPYRNLDEQTFDSVLDMLSEGFEGRSVKFGAYLHRDKVNRIVRGRRGARLTAVTNGGAIPETGTFAMVAEPENITVGTLDEDFAVESNAGDIILLGNTSWRVKRVEQARGRVLVTDAHGAPPTVPFWRGEAPARTYELSAYVSLIRNKISEGLPEAKPGVTLLKDVQCEQLIEWMQIECGLDRSGSEQVIEYVMEGRAALGAVPTQEQVIAERFFDESGGMQLIIHAPFGARINKAWGLALRKRFCRSFNLELQAAATDDGINIALSEKHSFPLADVFYWLHPNSVDEVLEQAVLQAPLFATRWRWDATRALALLRFRGGKKVPPQLQRMRAEDLLATVFPQAAACQDNVDGDIELPDHPLVNEAMKDVLTEALDIEGFKDVLRRIEKGSIKCVAVDTPMPSQFAHEILNANPYAYLDDAPIEERRARAVEMRRMLPPSLLEEVGKLDPAAIARVTAEAWPDVRDADELHDTLLTMIALPEYVAGLEIEQPLALWHDCFVTLEHDGRAAAATVQGRRFWFSAERARTFNMIYPDAQCEASLRDVEKSPPADRETAITNLVKGWMLHSGPITAADLAGKASLSERDVDLALLRLETSGAILRGNFTGTTAGVTEWCERRLLSRIHKLTVSVLRQQIEPVSAAQFMRWLLQWQHLAPGSQLTGERGLLEVLKQLQGFEIPANAWEQQILARRVKNYKPDDLDRLCLIGAVGWGRISPHPAIVDAAGAAAVVNRDGQNVHRSGTVSGAVAKEISLPALGSGGNNSVAYVRPLKSNALASGTPASNGGEDENDDSPKASVRRVVPTSVSPITFFVREDSRWMAPKMAELEDSTALSHAAREVYAYLKLRGASFFADIVRATNRLKSEVETGLWELVTAGLVTADGFDNLRALIDPRRRAGAGRARYSRPRDSTGRWSLLHSDNAEDRNVVIESTCWMLLNRYGVVFRDLLARETVLPTWRELLIAFRRLEDRGEIRGGRFVSGFLGEQFALPVAVESLRASKKQQPTAQPVTFSAADPLNLIGVIIPGDKVPAISTRTVTLTDGVASPLSVQLA